KGGIVFERDARRSNAFENTAQIHFSQPYPSIMVNHNVSPQTINCHCSGPDSAAGYLPEANCRICSNRGGVVSDALAHILERRSYYKLRVKETADTLKDEYSARQNSLKWMLVTSFGYLGFRNAKFGKIESHESVTAFGRDKLLTAKEL